MMLPAGLIPAPSAPSSGPSASSADSPSPGPTAPKLDYRTLQNLLAGLLAEWGAAGVPPAGNHAAGQQTSKAQAADAAAVAPAAVAPPESASVPAGTQAAQKPVGNANPTVAAADMSSRVVPSVNGIQPTMAIVNAAQTNPTFSREPPGSAAVTPGPAASIAGVLKPAGDQSAASLTAVLADTTARKGVTTAQVEVPQSSGANGLTPAPAGAGASGSARLLSDDIARAQDLSAAPGIQAGPQNYAAAWSGSVTQQFAVSAGETATAAITALSTEPTGQNAKAEKVNAATDANGPTVSWQAGATPATDRPQAAPVTQVGTEIIARVQQLGPEGRTDFHFQLQPPELGPVRVHLSSVDGQVSARLLVREDATRQLLQTHLDALVQRLSQAGISLGRFDVAQDGTGFQERWQNANAASSGERMPTTPVTAVPRQATTGSLAASSSVIDVIA